MTTGVITTGLFNNPPNDHFHYSKSWAGQDGRVISGQLSPKTQWNQYTMTMGRIRTKNPNTLGYTYNGAYSQVDNHTWESAGGDPGTSGYRASSGSGTSFPLTFPNSTFDYFWTQDIEYELLSKLIKKVKDHDSHLGVALAEVDKLAGTVVNTLKSIAFGVEDLAHLRFARFARRFGASPPTREVVRHLRVRDISGRFLEMKYAWEPTIQDTFSAVKAFEAISSGPRKSAFRAGTFMSRALKYNTNYVDGVNQVVTLRKSILYEMYEEMDALRQVGLLDPLSVIWERLPWSFIVDWFMPIGSYLDLIGQVPYMNGRFLVTRSIKWSSSGSYGMKAFTSLHKPAAPFVDCDWERFYLERSLTAGLHVPAPAFKVAGAVHGKRVWNAIALASQAFARYQFFDKPGKYF